MPSSPPIDKLSLSFRNITKGSKGSFFWPSLVFIIGAALFISFLYLSYSNTSSSLSPKDFALDASHLARFPPLDMGENLAIGFNLSNGLAFEHDTVVTHMPGLYQYLAFFYKITGLAQGTPSPGLFAACNLVAVVALSFLDLACLFVGLRILGFGFLPSTLLSFTMLMGMAFGYDILLPMSENVIPFIFFVQFTLFIRMLWRNGNISRFFIHAAWALTFLPLINLLVGLTIAPSVLFLWLVTFGLVVIKLKKYGLNELVYQKSNIAFLLPLGLTVVLLLFEFCTLDLKALWFWTIEVNKTQIRIPPWVMIQSSLAKQSAAYLSHEAHFIGNTFLGVTISKSASVFSVIYSMGQHMIGGTIIELAFATLFLCIIAQPRGSKDNIKLYVLIITAFTVLFLSYWRRNTGYKSEVTCGTAWALILWGTVMRAHILRTAENKIFFYMISVFGAVSFVFLIVYLRTTDIGASHLPSRLASLDSANVCRFRSTEPCRCLQISKFGPEEFIKQDMRQCQDRYATFGDMVFKNSIAKEWLISDLNRKDVAFIVYPPNKIDLLTDDRDPRIMYAFYDGLLHCEDYNGKAKICYNP